jgi:hypothetical protein
VSALSPLCARCRFACIIALEAGLHSSVHDTWLGSELYNLCGENMNNQGSQPDGIVEACSRLDIGSWYVAAYSWSIMVITGAVRARAESNALSPTTMSAIDML